MVVRVVVRVLFFICSWVRVVVRVLVRVMVAVKTHGFCTNAECFRSQAHKAEWH